MIGAIILGLVNLGSLLVYTGIVDEYGHGFLFIEMRLQFSFVVHFSYPSYYLIMSSINHVINMYPFIDIILKKIVGLGSHAIGVEAIINDLTKIKSAKIKNSTRVISFCLSSRGLMTTSNVYIPR